MGYSCNVVAVSPGIPRTDIQKHPEGGVDAAVAAVARFFPEHSPTGRSTTAEDGFSTPNPDHLYVGTWGDTVVIGLEDPDTDAVTAQLADHIAPHEIIWSLSLQSTVDHCGFGAQGPGYDRSLVAWSDADPDTASELITGTPLPFEEPYLAGEHPSSDDPAEQSDYPYPFHPLDLGNAAMLWIFGVEAETPPEDAIVADLLPHRLNPWDLPMHEFSGPEPDAGPPRPGW